MSYAKAVGRSLKKVAKRQPITNTKHWINYELESIHRYIETFGAKTLAKGVNLPDINPLIDQLRLLESEQKESGRDYCYSGPEYERMASVRQNISDVLLLYQHRNVMHWISLHESLPEQKPQINVMKRYMFATSDRYNPMKILSTGRTEEEAKLKIIQHLMTDNALDLTGCYCRRLSECKNITGADFDHRREEFCQTDPMDLHLSAENQKRWLERSLDSGFHIFFCLINTKLSIVTNDTIVVSCLDG